MPQRTVQLPNGQTATIDAPEGATDEQVLRFVKQQFDAGAFGGLTPEQEAIRADAQRRVAEIEGEKQQLEANRPTFLGEVGRRISSAAQGGTGTALLDALSQADPEGFVGQTAGDILGAQESARAITAGALAEPVAGIAGVGAATLGGADQGAEAVQQVQGAIAQAAAPRTQAGRERLTELGEDVQGAMELARAPAAGIGGLITAATEGDLAAGAQTVERVQEGGVSQALGDFTLEATGSPELATLVRTAPAAIAEIVAVRGFGKLRPGTQLLDDAGAPTKALKKELNKQGLVYENLRPEVQATIPKEVPAGLRSATATKTVSEDLLKRQIIAGGGDDALATLKVVNDSVVPDAKAVKAVNQGFRPNTVQMVKTANPATKKSMQDALTIMERLKADESVKARPIQAAGKAVHDRLTFIRGKADDARKRLNEISKTEFEGVPVDIQPVAQSVNQVFDQLNLNPPSFRKGKPVIDFQGSLIMENAASKRAIKGMVNLLHDAARGGTPDAKKLHVLKRQLDDIINFNKEAKTGLSGEGERALRDVRTTINQTLRGVNPEYAEVNDVLSSSLTAFDNLQQAAGRTVDIFGDKAARNLGQELRKILTNYRSGGPLDDSIEEVTALANNLGGDFSSDPATIVRFANALDDRFGAAAQGSMKGIQQGAAGRMVEAGAVGGATGAAVEGTRQGVRALSKKVKGVSDFEAFRALEELLKEGT